MGTKSMLFCVLLTPTAIDYRDQTYGQPCTTDEGYCMVAEKFG